METSSALLAICAGNSRFSKQSWGWWLETSSRSLWRNCNANENHEYRMSMNKVWLYTCLLHELYTRNMSLLWWRHQMETFSALLVLCVGNSPVTGEFPPQRPVTRSCNWINGWANNREAGDLRRHRAHSDVIVMILPFIHNISNE